jgi:hypothetical protein
MTYFVYTMSLGGKERNFVLKCALVFKLKGRKRQTECLNPFYSVFKVVTFVNSIKKVLLLYGTERNIAVFRTPRLWVITEAG